MPTATTPTRSVDQASGDLITTAAAGYLAAVRASLADGADVRTTDGEGATALVPAAYGNHLDVAAALAVAGVDLDHVNSLGWTALLEAVILGHGDEVHQKVVARLVEAGVDRRVIDRDGRAALDHARQRGYAEMVRLLSG